MTRSVISITPDTSIKEFASILLANNISGTPVVNQAGQLLAIATESDLIFHNKKFKAPPVITILDSFLFLNNPEKMDRELKKIAAATVQDICTEDLTTRCSYTA